jgi:chromosome segregation ATPase
MPFLLLAPLALVAQAPANLDLAQQFNTALPGINQQLKELKTQEALAKVQTLIPAVRPVFDASNAKAIVLSLDNAQGLMSLYRLYANVASEAGQWEKAVEIQEKRSQAARATLADLDRAQAPLLTQWKQVAADSGDFVAKNEPRKKELETKVAAFKAEYDEIKASKRKLTKQEADAFNARGTQVQKDEDELAQINAALPVHKQNLANAPKVTKMLGDNRKEVDGMVKAADEAVVKAKKAVADQNDEITQFNTQQVLKKVKIVGRKNWVDAVLRAPENITKLGSPQLQAAFLNRLLVLDPGNAGAQKALDNLVAGKDAFAKDPKSGKKGGAKKK